MSRKTMVIIAGAVLTVIMAAAALWLAHDTVQARGASAEDYWLLFGLGAGAVLLHLAASTHRRNQ